MRLYVYFLICCTLLGCDFKRTQTANQDTLPMATAVVVDYPDLRLIIETSDEKLRVVNFWATWCAPCVAELPSFMGVHEAYKNDSLFQMILVSLDEVQGIDTKVNAFLQKNNITTDVYLLDDNKRMNEWITFFDSTWTGAIPATLFYKNGEKVAFREGPLSREELEAIIKLYK